MNIARYLGWEDMPDCVRHNFYRDMLAGSLFGLFAGGFFPFLAPFFRQCGAGNLEISLIFAAPCIGMLFCPAWAHICKKKHPVRVIRWADSLSRAVLLFLPLFPDVHGMVWLTFVYFISSTFSAPVYSTAMQVVYPAALRGRCMGMVRLAVMICNLFSSWAMGWLTAYLKPAQIFALFSLFGVLSAQAFGGMRIKDAPDAGGEEKAGADVRYILRKDRKYAYFLFSMMIFGVGSMVAGPLYVYYQVDVFRISGALLSRLAAIGAFFSLIFYYLWGRLSERKNALPLMILILILMSAAGFIYIFSPGAALMAAAAAMGGAGAAGFDLIGFLLILEFAGDRNAAPYMSLNMVAMGIRGTVCPFIGSLLHRLWGLQAALAISLGFMLAGAAMMSALMKRTTAGHLERGRAVGR
ncbi:MAG: MFS transporter [Bacillota bacterium]